MAGYEPPRAPIRRDKSGSWDLPDNYTRECETFREASREEARRTHRLNAEAERVADYIKALMGNQWPEGYRRWRSRFVDNRLAKARVDHLADITDTLPVIDCSTAVDAYKGIANAIELMIRADWTRIDCDLKLVTAADIADTYGTGFWRTGAASPGINSITPCGPDQVMPIQPGFDIQEASAVLFRTWKPLWWVKQKFPYGSANIERELMNTPLYGNAGANNQNMGFNRPAHIDEITWNGLSQGMKRVLGVKGAPVTDPSIGRYYRTLEVEELFVNDPTENESPNSVIVSDPFLPLTAHNWWYEVQRGRRLFPRKRHMIWAGHRLLSDGPSPYWHGLYPFSTLRFNPVFWSFWGLSRYRDLLPLNTAMNEIVAACMDLIKRALNPTAVTKEGAVSPAVWKEFYPDMPGMKLRVGANTQLNEALRYMDPPNIPTYVVEMLRGWLAPEFDRLSGAVDISQMIKKKQLPGGDTIDSMRDAQGTGVRLEERMLEVFLRDAGQQVVSNIIQFSTAEYRMKRLGEAGLVPQDFNSASGNMLPEDAAAHPDFWKQFALSISAGSMHSGAKDQEKSVAMNLAGRRLLPIRDMYEKLEIPDPEGTFERLLQEEQLTAQVAGMVAGGGGGRPANP